MRFVLFYHSLVSDWNHGNAHFLRGYATELIARGHEVVAFEPAGGWSRENLLREHGAGAIQNFHERYPLLSSTTYSLDRLDIDAAIDGADVVIAHEWNEPELIARLGEHRRRNAHYRLLFHDTHHRAVSAPHEMARYDLSAFDGALVFGEVLRDIYRRRAWCDRAWTWHEAADIRVFQPIPGLPCEGDLIWIGNWADDEREHELQEFLLQPARRLGLRGSVHGVRYPEHALRALREAGLRYRGWLPNADAPDAFARHRVTIHVPRRPYAQALPGIPTIRVFEALACGIPLVSAPWHDAEGLFTPGKDYLVARDGAEMAEALHFLLRHPAAVRRQAQLGLDTILGRHTCGHRVDELLAICRELGVEEAVPGGREAEPLAS